MKCDGVITDLMMAGVGNRRHRSAIHPAGLFVLIVAAALQKPVVVCTDCDGDHHSESLSWIYDGFVRNSMDYILFDKMPMRLGWVETKDWGAALRLLERLCQTTEPQIEIF